MFTFTGMQLIYYLNNKLFSICFQFPCKATRGIWSVVDKNDGQPRCCPRFMK